MLETNVHFKLSMLQLLLILKFKMKNRLCIFNFQKPILNFKSVESVIFFKLLCLSFKHSCSLYAQITSMLTIIWTQTYFGIL